MIRFTSLIIIDINEEHRNTLSLELMEQKFRKIFRSYTANEYCEDFPSWLRIDIKHEKHGDGGDDSEGVGETECKWTKRRWIYFHNVKVQNGIKRA